MSVFSSLARSRKFWIMLLDLVVSIIGYFTAKYINPATAKDVLFLVGAFQPAILFVIGGIALEDAAQKFSGRDVRQ